MSYVQIIMDFAALESDQKKIIDHLNDQFDNGLTESHQTGCNVRLFASVRAHSPWLQNNNPVFEINGTCIATKISIQMRRPLK